MLGVCALAATGCAEISLHTVDTHETVLSSRQQVVAGSSVRVRSRIDGTTLFLETNQGCDLVQMEEVRRVELREADEDLTEEFTVLGLATLPLVTGIVMLVDAPNVYEADRNSAQYNPVGPEGAYIGGTVLTAVGGLMALIPIIELMRVAAAGEETESTTTRQGATVSANVPCDTENRPIATSVTLVVGATHLSTPGTNHEGRLELDLARAIPHDVAKRAVSVQVIVAGRVVGELDIEPILDAQEEMMREDEAKSWKQVDRTRCVSAPLEDTAACESVQAFLNRFPEGLHSNEARDLLSARAKRSDKVIASDDEGAALAAPEPAPFDAAAEEARKLQQQSCKNACVKSCQKTNKGGKPGECVEACVKEVCQ
jgi:hypothetical protein